MDEFVGKSFRVLDDGFVRVVDYMGGDDAIVQAARISYGDGTTRVREDRGLIRYLMRHHHTTPFEMCELKLHVRVPMDCWRQWIRHRTANVNEYSTRYSKAIDGTQKTRLGEWRRQSGSNRQGSVGGIEEKTGHFLSRREDELKQLSHQVYEERLSSGVAREQARKDLPLSTYTEAYWKIDLHNLFHFLALRMDDHAQKEIRDFANVIGNEIVSMWCPIAWSAFVDYRLNARVLSRIEWKLLQILISGDSSEAKRVAVEEGLLSFNGGVIKRNRERAEFEAKLLELGVDAPWQETE